MKKDTVTPMLSANMSSARSTGDEYTAVFTLMLPKINRTPIVKMVSATRKPNPELIPNVPILKSPV